MNRSEVVVRVQQALQSELEAVERMAAMATEEATGAESKSEGKYDTRATEASYLARGQANRVVALRRLVAWVSAMPAPGARVGLGSVVQIDEDERRSWLLMLPDGGGVVVQVGGEPVRVVTPRSPVGQALVGAEVGDEVEIEASERVLEVLYLG